MMISNDTVWKVRYGVYLQQRIRETSKQKKAQKQLLKQYKIHIEQANLSQRANSEPQEKLRFYHILRKEMFGRKRAEMRIVLEDMMSENIGANYELFMKKWNGVVDVIDKKCKTPEEQFNILQVDLSKTIMDFFCQDHYNVVRFNQLNWMGTNVQESRQSTKNLLLSPLEKLVDREGYTIDLFTVLLECTRMEDEDFLLKIVDKLESEVGNPKKFFTKGQPLLLDQSLKGLFHNLIGHKFSLETIKRVLIFIKNYFPTYVKEVCHPYDHIPNEEDRLELYFSTFKNL